ncbi:odorant receptor 67c-like [Leptopilina boulardi]|uniref:odorant receptor 67c-like n=1 Tax=Leptopilina boulardi TaxID=63433 RepID=UPI0021F55865|nr:odorant receptor 67c-like [Leptopilina boulardi]
MNFHHSYFYINKFLLSIIGLWPYQSKTEKIIGQIFVLIVWAGHIPSTARRFVVIWGNEDEMIESFVIYFTATLGMVKLWNSLHKNNKMKQLLEKINADWNIWSNEPEFEILEKFAEEGRKFSLIYAIALYCSVLSYTSFTLSPQLLDTFMPLPNGTREKKYLLPEDFGTNSENYFYLIFLADMISIFVNFTITASVDSMYVVYVQHACGIFSAIGQRLENIKFDCNANDKKYSRDNISREIFFCVQQHKSVLKYTEDLEDTYTVYFFFLILINMIILIVNGVQIVIKFGDFDDVFKFGNYAILLIGHLLFNSIPGQKLLDHSVTVSQAAYNACWYDATQSVKRSLIFIIMRSSKPCKITAGKYYILSMANFSMVR